MALTNLKGLSELAQAVKSQKGKAVLTVPIDDVVPKAQVRKRFRHIEALAATLLTEGQQSPIIVFPKNKAGKFVIQKGERRWRACQQAGIQTIDVIINDKIQNNVDETAGELIENLQRDDLTPLEIAAALNTFIEEGWKQNAIAVRLGKTISFVSTHLSLLKLPACVRELHDNDISLDTETLNNLRLLYDFNAPQCHAVCAAARSVGITRKQSRTLVNEAKRINEEQKNTAQTSKHQNNGFPSIKNEEKNVAIAQEASPQKHSSRTHYPDQKQQENGAAFYEANDFSVLTVTTSMPWKPIPADRLIFAVKVNVNGEAKHGVIMTDRVAVVPSQVWVELRDNEGTATPLSVPVSDIELLSVKS